MKKVSALLIVLVALVTIIFLIHNNSSVEIMAVDTTPDTILIAVKGLPYTAKSKFDWWLENKNALIDKYKLDFTKQEAQPSVYIYDFGDGFKKEEIKDRLCFNSVPSPKNCIDKKIVMVISQMRDRSVKITIDNDMFIQDKNGRIIDER